MTDCCSKRRWCRQKADDSTAASPVGRRAAVFPGLFLAAVAAAVVATGGCAQAWRPGMGGVERPARDESIDLAVYRAPPSCRVRTYYRMDPTDPEQRGGRYAHWATAAGRVEGNLIGLDLLPLSTYVSEAQSGEARPRLPWPKEEGIYSEGTFLEFSPPIVWWPATLSVTEPAVFKSKVRCFLEDGRPLVEGRAERRIWFEGHETIPRRSGEPTRCARLRARTTLRLTWFLYAEFEEYVWLAEGRGVIRRTERLSGVLLRVFRFSSVHRYDLLNQDLGSGEGAPSVRGIDRAFSRIAIHFDRVLPSPRVGGLIVEWVGEGL
ncbi:MAG: hypothetical protein IIC02_00510 [Planctomycetes bacterium]|nr:hypothetical protein [Planctomycetota bacterium]